MTDIEVVLNRVRHALDKPTATLVVSDDPAERHFIGEAFLIGAALFVLQKYCAAFLQGIGLEEAAKAHGEKARKLLGRIRSGAFGDKDVGPQKADVDEALKTVSANPSPEGIAAAETALTALLRESGATRKQAEHLTHAVTQAVAPARRR